MRLHIAVLMLFATSALGQAEGYDFSVRSRKLAGTDYNVDVTIKTPERKYVSHIDFTRVPDERVARVTTPTHEYTTTVTLDADGGGTATLQVFLGQQKLAQMTKRFEPVKLPAHYLRVTKEMTGPQVVRRVPPFYPHTAKADGIQGLVMLEVDVNEHGWVEGAHVIRGLGYGLDESAIAAVKQWKFEPATRDGKPVPTSSFVTVNFKLQ